MIYSGLDWSGSPGKAHGPRLVFAVVHIDGSELPTLNEEIAGAKRRLGIDANHVFSHTGSGPKTQEAFFASMRRVPFTGHIYMLDKIVWAKQQIGKPTGPACLRDGILTLIARCPDSVVAGNVLYIDLRADETRALEDYRTGFDKRFARQDHGASASRMFGLVQIIACKEESSSLPT